MSDIKESFYNKLDEVRSETLKSYIKKAKQSKKDADWETKFTKYWGDDASPSMALSKKREKGIERAKKRLNKE